MRKFRDRFIRAHGFLYIVRGMPGAYVVFTNRQAIWPGKPLLKTAKDVRTAIKRHALERLLK